MNKEGGWTPVIITCTDLQRAIQWRRKNGDAQCGLVFAPSSLEQSGSSIHCAVGSVTMPYLKVLKDEARAGWKPAELCLWSPFTIPGKAALNAALERVLPTRLHLRNSGCVHEAAVAVARGVSIPSLCVQDEIMTPAIRRELFASLCGNSSLKTLRIEGCELSGDDMHLLGKALRANRGLNNLHVDTCILHRDAVHAFADAILRHPCLSSLHIDNVIAPGGASAHLGAAWAVAERPSGQFYMQPPPASWW